MKDNLKEYEQLNSHTLDILYGIIDFEQFKLRILEFKKTGDQKTDGVEESKETAKDIETFDQGMNYESFMKEYNTNPDDKSSGWVRKLNKDFKKDGYTCKVW